MRRNRSVTLPAVIVGLLLGVPLVAQQPAPQTGQQAGARPPREAAAQSAPEAPTDGAAPATTGTLRKASELLGAEVRDGDDKIVGRIEDIVVDSNDGRAQFAAVSAGMYINAHVKGAASRLVGMPLELLHANGDHLVLTDVSKGQLATASFFTEESWPGPENREWVATEWKHFNCTPYWHSPPPAHLPTKRDANGLVDPPPPPPPPAGPTWTCTRLSALLHTTVRNRTGDEFGKADNLVLDMGRHQIVFVVVTPAGALGLDGKLIAAPWTAMSHSGERMIIDVDKGRYPQAPAFDKDLWPDFGDSNWQAEVSRFFAAQPVSSSAGG